MAGPDRKELAELVRRLSVVHGRVTLSSGKEADYYVDLRRATLHHRASALIGTLMRELTSDWDYDVVSQSLADIARGKVISIPGLQYKAIIAAERLVPRTLMRAVTKRIGSGRGRT